MCSVLLDHIYSLSHLILTSLCTKSWHLLVVVFTSGTHGGATGTHTCCQLVGLLRSFCELVVTCTCMQRYLSYTPNHHNIYSDVLVHCHLAPPVLHEMPAQLASAWVFTATLGYASDCKMHHSSCVCLRSDRGAAVVPEAHT